MKKYELMCIFNTEEKTIEEHLNFINENFSGNKVNVVETKEMGKRELAYPIKEISHGHYYLYQLEMEQKNLPELEKSFKLYKGLLRYFMLRK